MSQHLSHDAPETEIVTTYRVACDGSSPALGHPRVWLQIPQDLGWVECSYCDKRFIHADHEQEVLRKGGAERT
jgi:uncharacterized Zn-finger protein